MYLEDDQSPEPRSHGPWPVCMGRGAGYCRDTARSHGDGSLRGMWQVAPGCLFTKGPPLEGMKS